jgi:hypothetical protein
MAAVMAINTMATTRKIFPKIFFIVPSPVAYFSGSILVRSEWHSRPHPLNSSDYSKVIVFTKYMADYNMRYIR